MPDPETDFCLPDNYTPDVLSEIRRALVVQNGVDLDTELRMTAWAALRKDRDNRTRHGTTPPTGPGIRSAAA